MKIDYGRWRSLQGYGAFAHEKEEPLFVQFSGGRTSGMMACMAPDKATFSFQNTGHEHEKTLEFVRNVGDAIERDIIWLEFRPPATLGDPPKKFLFERVDFKTASRDGTPFFEFMRSINAYREACGNPPIAPWAKGRICTTHLKHRVLDHYVKSIGIYAHDRWVGIRADEPHRVPTLRAQETRDKGLLVPLYLAGIDKPTVLDFWSRQPFDLGIEEFDGNCDGCFLKDQSDISRSLGRKPVQAARWIEYQAKYPRFGGQRFPQYEALVHEYITRMRIEDAFRLGEEPEDDGRLEPKHFRLVVRQEKKRWEEGPSQFSCACEGSMGNEEDEEEPWAAQ